MNWKEMIREENEAELAQLRRTEELEEKLAEARASVEALTDERDAASLLARNRGQRLAEALAALEPFARLADEIEQCAAETSTKPDGWAMSCAWEDLLRARAVFGRPRPRVRTTVRDREGA
jgi:hypothetical protein